MFQMIKEKRKFCICLVLILGAAFFIIASYRNVRIPVEERIEEILNTWYVRGNASRTIEELESLLRKTKRKKGDYSKDIVTVEISLAAVYTQTGRYCKAEERLVEAEKISRESRLEESPIEDLYKAYGEYEASQSNYEASLNYYKEAIQWCNKLHGDNSTQGGAAYLRMSYIYLEIDELEDAERCAELAMKPNYSDHRRLFYINALITLGDIRMKEGKYELALSKYEEAYKWYNTIFVTDTKEGALIIGSIQERIKEAKRVMEEGG